MPTDANETIVAEEIKKDEDRFKELNTKQDRSEEENKELGEIKERYKTRMQKRIDELTWKAKSTGDELEKERKERERLEAELNELKGKVSSTKPDDTDFTEIGGKKYLTDDALLKKVKSGEITDAEAFKYQRNRDREEDRLTILKSIKGEDEQEKNKQTMIESAQAVLKKYPHFSKDHKDFNPENLLYKKAMEYYNKGYKYDPKGILAAVEDAEDYFKSRNVHIDNSGEHNIEEINAGEEEAGEKNRGKEVTLNEAEKEAAIRMYCRGDVNNPKTQRPYTEKEALTKALEAKKGRLAR